MVLPRQRLPQRVARGNRMAPQDDVEAGHDGTAQPGGTRAPNMMKGIDSEYINM